MSSRPGMLFSVVGSAARAGPDSTLLNWYPGTRDPADLWELYSGHRELLSLDNQRRAEADLSVLGLPTNLDPRGFRHWVSAGLLSSSFVADVRQISAADEPGAFLQLGDDWGLEPGAARYAAETVRDLVIAFLGFLLRKGLRCCIKVIQRIKRVLRGPQVKASYELFAVASGRSLKQKCPCVRIPQKFRGGLELREEVAEFGWCGQVRVN